MTRRQLRDLVKMADRALAKARACDPYYARMPAHEFALRRAMIRYALIEGLLQQLSEDQRCGLI